MPRAGTGTCTTPAGQPVVAGTVISDVVFNALVTDIYTILTDSLSRTGSGSMSVPLGNPDGLVGAPGISFTSEPGSGLYRAGANDIRLSIAGVDRASWTTAGFLAAAADIALIDRAGTIGIGTTSGTTITIGRSGQTLTLPGTVDAATIDRSGTISIGATSGTTITIGRTGQSVVFPGTVSNLWNRSVASSDTTCNSNVTATDISGLSFSCASGKQYLVRGVLFLYADATATGIGINVKLTGAPTCSTQFSVRAADGVSGQVTMYALGEFSDTPAVHTDTQSNVSLHPGLERIDSYFVTTGTGTYQLVLISEVNMSTVTVKAGSYLEWLEFT